jgi:hypothetical protein
MQEEFGHGGQGKKVLVASHLDARGRRFEGAVLQLQISAATDSHLVLAYSIYDGRRMPRELDDMTNVCFLEESRWQSERLPSHT